MRVLIVTHMALPHVGGLEVIVDYEIRALVAAGHEVVLITSDGTGQARQPTYPDTVTVLRVHAWHVLERRFRLPYPIFSPRLFGILWRETGRADVVHIHGFMFMSSPIAAMVARMRGRDAVLTDHGGIQKFESKTKSILARIGAETVGRFTARSADRLIGINGQIVRTLDRLSGRHGQCIFLPNPVDRELFQPASSDERARIRASLGWATNRRKVLFVGRLNLDKGVGLLLKCTDPAYDIVFCGSGDPSILGELPRDGIEYLAPRPHVEVAKLYKAADLVVLPSIREGFPLVVQEAISCGRKVILSYDEAFEPYRPLPGLVFCERSVGAFRRGIQEALQSPDISPADGDISRFCPSFADWVSRIFGKKLTLAPCQPAARTQGVG